MIVPASFIERNPPEWVRKLEVRLLIGAFARSLDKARPSVRGKASSESLHVLQEFSAEALRGSIAAEKQREARQVLYSEAVRLGKRMRKVLRVKPHEAFSVTRFVYRGIDIEIEGCIPGEICFTSCSFARVYSPEMCWCMSAFDSGFMAGLYGEGELVFASRITEGCSECRACFRL